jgi:hypothetical protein
MVVMRLLLIAPWKDKAYAIREVCGFEVIVRYWGQPHLNTLVEKGHLLMLDDNIN